MQIYVLEIYSYLSYVIFNFKPFFIFVFYVLFYFYFFIIVQLHLFQFFPVALPRPPNLCKKLLTLMN